VNIILKGSSFITTCHVSPDGDAVGSMLSMGGILKLMGKQVTLYNRDEIPYNFQFLSLADSVVHTLPQDLTVDATLIVDCGEFDRLGNSFFLKPNAGVLINIDHHLSNLGYGHINYIDPEAAAVGEMIFEIAKALKVRINREIAACIYTSILSDTGSFRYRSTTTKVLRVAGELLSYGVDPWEVSSHIYENHPIARLEILKRSLQTLHYSRCGRYASLTVTRRMLEEAGGSYELLDGFINLTRGIQGVEVSILFREMHDSHFKISFRSRGNIDVGVIGSAFGGGGHYNAAGCVLQGTLTKIQEQVYRAVEKAIDDQMNSTKNTDPGRT
jgi:phosphoesterase RecJ-like protein